VVTAPEPNFAHLLALSGPQGTYEHAEHALARVEHGYCTDDVARVLLVAVREPVPSSRLLELAQTSMRFLEIAQSRNGRFRNRRLASGSFRGPSTNEDCWGRAMWALGTTIARRSESSLGDFAERLFARGVGVRSPWSRSSAFAALGAVEALSADSGNVGARHLVDDAARSFDRNRRDGTWLWPEPRLTYSNAVLPESMIAVGHLTGDRELVDIGIERLRWLLDLESLQGHLSVAPAGGWGPGEATRRFDQQPIEVAAMADACTRAFDVTGERGWLDGRDMAVNWFLGSNDVGALMYDPTTGGGYDGLTATGPNLNQGAESTIAYLTTMQHARRLAPAIR